MTKANLVSAIDSLHEQVFGFRIPDIYSRTRNMDTSSLLAIKVLLKTKLHGGVAKADGYASAFCRGVA